MTPLWAVPVAILAVGLVAVVMASQHLTAAVQGLREQLQMLGEIRTEVDGLRAEAALTRAGGHQLAERRRRHQSI